MRFDDVVNLHLKSSFFVESPMYYDSSFNEKMQEEHHNKEVTEKIISNEIFDKFLNFDVYKIKDNFDDNIFTYCIVNDGLTKGFMEIASKKENNFSRGVWQKKEEKGLMRKFVVDFLPKHHDNLISDKTANKLGISFYRKLIEDCVNKGYKVTILKGSLKNEIPFDMKNFRSYWHNVDSDVPTHPTFLTRKDDLFKIYFKI
jgi:ribosome modulation factor